MKVTHYLFLILIGCFYSAKLIAQDHIQFKNYTINDGLSQSYVSCVAQDDLGALWIGTQDGINRFNGKEFEVFTADKGYDISNEFIITVKKDTKGNVWFGTYDGLIKYNLYSELFQSYSLENKERIEIRSLDFDHKGNVWVGTAFGNIYKFDVEKQVFKSINKSAFESSIVDLKIDGNRIVIVSEYEGVLISTLDFKETEKYFVINEEFNRKVVVNRLIQYPFGNFLIATNKGLYELSESKNSFVQFQPETLHLIEELNIKDVVFLSQHRFFIASENNGIYQVDHQEDTTIILNYTTDYFQKGALLTDKINHLFQDKKGSIWVSSHRGISSFNPNNDGFIGVGFSGNLKKGLPSQNIWGFGEDEDAHYLFVAADHGVSRFDKRERVYHHFYRKATKNEDITTLGLHIINKNKALVVCFDGLYELSINENDPSDYTFKLIKHKTGQHRGFNKNYTILQHTDEQTFLIGSKAGLSVFHRENNRFDYFSNNPDDSTSIGAGPVRLIFKTIDNRFFACPSSGGLYEIIKGKEGAFEIEKPLEFDTLINKTKDYFTSAIQTGNDEFWFGTLGDGLYYYNTNTKELAHYDKKNGLPNNVIYGIEKSPKNNVLWLSTNRGVVKFNLKTKSFILFTEADGLMSDELNLGASFTSNSGLIYFGGIQGYNYFDPRQELVKKTDLKVYFSRIEVENKKITPQKSELLAKSISFTPQITLPYSNRSLNLYFFADDLSNPERIAYKYILSGKDDIKEELGTSNHLRFASLAPGEYQLAVHARSYNGEWNTKPARITILVSTPFWLTWWFYSIITLVVLMVVFIRVKRSIEKERRQQVKLELKIAERTKEIRLKTLEIGHQKEKLEEQKLALEKEKEKSERLLNNLLPKETAFQLKNEGQSAARDFNMVSVMFTDFVGFTKVAENMSAKDLVAILDTFFRKFDSIIDDHDLEKIKTIGDAYMCAGGVPIRNKTNPINTVLAAIQIQEYMRQRKEEALKKGEYYWKLRIGINTGPVSAGVIGTKRYAYDVWGRTVNRAQRMEQLCEPEKIAITEDTFRHIEPYFECIEKGKVTTKSGLEIFMYEVTSIKPALSENGKGIVPNDSFHKLVNLHFFSKINYYKAERFLMQKLEKELDPKLHYHSLEHSKDVTKQAERIAIGEGITDEDLFLLKTAASYHDAGFVKQYDKNEPIGAAMAQDILPNFGYTQKHIDRIKELIFVTQIPHQPKNKLEEIICDADLDYLGRDDFHEIADLLRIELKEHKKIESDRQWDEIQVSFLKQHRYFTRTAIETRRAKKLENLAIVERRLKEKDYED